MHTCGHGNASDAMFFTDYESPRGGVKKAKETVNNLR